MALPAVLLVVLAEPVFAEEAGQHSPGLLYVRIVDTLAGGVVLGLVLALAGVGVVLVFSTSGLFNLAHGELLAFGGLLALLLDIGAWGPRLHVVPATMAVAVVTALVGAGLERGVWRRLRARAHVTIRVHLTALAVALLGQQALFLALFAWGPGGRPRFFNYGVQDPMRLGPVTMTPRDGAVFLISMLLLSGLAIVLRSTRFGRSIRALADDADLARLSGVRIERLRVLVWALAGALAGVSGVFLWLSESTGATIGFHWSVLVFAAAVLGGLRSPLGAVAGGVLVGVTAKASALWISDGLLLLVPVAVTLVVLLVRSRGRVVARVPLEGVRPALPTTAAR